MRMVILAIGNREDVFPLIALGLKAKKMGHKVTICTSNNFESIIPELELSFKPCSLEFSNYNDGNHNELSNNKLNSKRKLKNEVIRPKIKASLNEFLVVCEENDVIISNLKAIGAYDIADYLKIPLIIISANEFIKPIKEFANSKVTIKNLGSFLNKSSYLLSREKYLKEINSFRVNTLKIEKRGKNEFLKKIRNNEIPIIYSISKYLFKDILDFDSGAYMPGFIFLESTDQVSSDLIKFISKKIRPILVILENSDIEFLSKFKDMFIEALKSTNNTAIVITQSRNFEFNSDLIYHIVGEYNERIFPLVKGIFNQGTIGILADSLKSGRPIALLPREKKQKFYANRCQNLNYLVDLCSEKDISKEFFEGAMIKMSEAKYILKAENIEEKIEKENATAKIVKYIEHYVSQDFYKV